MAHLVGSQTVTNLLKRVDGALLLPPRAGAPPEQVEVEVEDGVQPALEAHRPVLAAGEAQALVEDGVRRLAALAVLRQAAGVAPAAVRDGGARLSSKTGGMWVDVLAACTVHVLSYRFRLCIGCCCRLAPESTESQNSICKQMS